MTARPTRARIARGLAVAAAAAALAGCAWMPSFLGGSGGALKPAELQPNPNLQPVRQAWTARIGRVDFPLTLQPAAGLVVAAAGDGTVAAFDAATGAERWRGSAGGALSAGVGSDGPLAAVVTRGNELVVLSAGQPAWRQPLGVQSFTAPLVAGGRVFVLAADRSIHAFDAANGRKLWTQQRPGEALVLRQAGVLLAVGDTLVAGQGGRLAGLNPLTGAIRWESGIATSRGTNDVERLVDLVGRTSRVGDSVCARAFQSAVGCVDTRRGQLAWTRSANGAEGLTGDDRLVVGTEWDGKVIAWRRDSGERAWTHEALLQRGLSTPLMLGRTVAIGDAFGYVHLLSREDGSLRQRLSTDGSAIAAAPVLAGNTLVVVTRNGGVHGFIPE
ncbi:outer membrane protein assembly factor BamB [Ramlibacter sp. MAHUQ-53]|uniref:outer membrane protein assembly factor BamB n=1 Tax=unclassified Ramlibacter TaxID=2617605 RepID=UPI0036433C45